MLHIDQGYRVNFLAFLLCSCLLSGCDSGSPAEASGKQLVSQRESPSTSDGELTPPRIDLSNLITPSNSPTNAPVLEKEDVAHSPPLSAAEFIRRWKEGEENESITTRGEAILEADLEEIVKFLRESFPFRSIAHRLVQVESASRLKRLEEFNSSNKAKASDQEPTIGDSRAFGALQKLHSDSATSFVQSEGFGISRIVPLSPSDLPRKSRGPLALNTEYLSATELEDGPFIELPSQLVGSATEAIDSNPMHSAAAFQMPSVEILSRLSRQGTYQFGDRGRTGLVRSKAEVAGFQGHEVQNLWSNELGINLTEPSQFSDATVRWKVNRMELVSLLAHDEFGVYVSESLPKMNELNEAEIRKFDEFEFSALGKLFKGDDVVLAATANRIRMLGALRATPDCLECHSVKNGDLLGALSYELLRQPKVDVARDGERQGNQ